MKVIVVSGGFDPLHSGHISYFKDASEYGDRLIVVDDKGRVTTGSTPSINVTGVIYANTNAAGVASGSFAHVENQKIHISSSAPSSDSIGNNGDIWYQTL